MLFRNDGELVKVRFGSLRNYTWVNVKNGQTIECDERIGKIYGFTSIETIKSSLNGKNIETKIIKSGGIDG